MKLIVKKNEDKTITLGKDIKDSLFLTVEENAKLVLKVAVYQKMPAINLTAHLKKNANLEVVYADFSSGKNKVSAAINLDESGANATWHLASLASKQDQKEFNISFIHEAPNTQADMQNYGVALNEARLVFSGVNHIKNKAKKSNTNQSAKIIVFDEKASGKANPILRIDEHDVLASHAAIVGRLNDDHLFYLKSRGLSEKEAKTLIVYGYLTPIAKHFDKLTQTKITHLIEEKCHV